jgi:hypothetical protein
VVQESQPATPFFLENAYDPSPDRERKIGRSCCASHDPPRTTGPTRVVTFSSRICLPRPSFMFVAATNRSEGALQLSLSVVATRALLLHAAQPLPLIAHFISMDTPQLKFNMAMTIVASNTRSPTVSRPRRRGTSWNGCGVARSTDDGLRRFGFADDGAKLVGSISSWTNFPLIFS